MFRFCWFWAYIFLKKKKIVLIIVTLILSGKICCNFSHKNKILQCANGGCIWSMTIILFLLLPNKANSNLKATFFCGNNNPFFIKPTVAGYDFRKKKFFSVWNLFFTGQQTERNLFFHKKITLKLWSTWSLAL